MGMMDVQRERERESTEYRVKYLMVLACWDRYGRYGGGVVQGRCGGARLYSTIDVNNKNENIQVQQCYRGTATCSLCAVFSRLSLAEMCQENAQYTTQRTYRVLYST